MTPKNDKAVLWLKKSNGHEEQCLTINCKQLMKSDLFYQVFALHCFTDRQVATTNSIVHFKCFFTMAEEMNLSQETLLVLLKGKTLHMC